MTIMGAMFQLVPVITERNLYNESIARVTFYIYLVGVAWLVYAFATNAPIKPSTGIGWVGFIVIGFSFRLIPMFVLSHGYDEKKTQGNSI